MSSQATIIPDDEHPIQHFSEAARIIAERSLLLQDDPYERSRQSIAEGLSQELKFPVAPENLLLLPSAMKGLALSAEFLGNQCEVIKKMALDAGEQVPEFTLIVRGPIDQSLKGALLGRSFRVLEITEYDIGNIFDDYSSVSFDHFMKALNDVSKSSDNPTTSNAFIIGYLDMNPSYPAGHVRERRETEHLADFFNGVRQKNIQHLTKFAPKSKLEKWGDPFLIIESRALHGFEFEHSKAFSFAQLSAAWSERTHALFDVADYQISDEEGGLLLAPAKDIAEMTTYVPSGRTQLTRTSILTSAFMFGNHPGDQELRQQFLQKQTAQSRLCAMITYAIVNGDADNFLTPEEHDIAKSWLNKYPSLPDGLAQNLLDHGIDGLKVLNVPDAAFSLIVSYEGLLKWDNAVIPSAQPDQLGVMKEYMASDAINDIKRIAKEKLAVVIEDGSRFLGDKRSTQTRDLVAVFILPTLVSPRALIENILILTALSVTVQTTRPFRPIGRPAKDQPYIKKPLPKRGLQKFYPAKFTW